MYRFVALSWDNRDSAKTSAAQRLALLLLSPSSNWRCVLNAPGLRVFDAPQPRGAYHAYVMKRNTGVILGRLFEGGLETDHIPSDPTFDDRESKLIIDSGGRRLVEHYWGHYVAFLRTSDGKRRFIVRDPTGALPCLLAKNSGIDVAASDLEDCVALNLIRFSVDWRHVKAFFIRDRLITRTTGFKEVTQVYAGECVAIKDDDVTTRMVRSFYWDPVDVYKASTIDDPSRARASLRQVVHHCVTAWASCYESIVHQLSGGLDSSIVAASLAKMTLRPDILCFHFFTEMSDGDERRYARAAAQRAGFELFETEVRSSERTLESMFNPSRVVTPAVLGFLPASQIVKRRLVEERQAGAIFSGQGGDHLFQQRKNEFIAAEYAHRHGLRLGFFRVVADTSRLTKQPIWSVLSAAVCYGLLRRSFDPYAIFEAPDILAEDSRMSVSRSDYSHPWVEAASRLPASKILQIHDVVDCQIFYLQSFPDAEQIHPLISQPIIECCLQIPNYVLAREGKARGLVREAFEPDVPTKIIRRQSKGCTRGYWNRLLVANAQFLREFLLDGVLVGEGILFRRALEKQLSERALIVGEQLPVLLNAVRAEAWLRVWADVILRTAP